MTKLVAVRRKNLIRLHAKINASLKEMNSIKHYIEVLLKTTDDEKDKKGLIKQITWDTVNNTIENSKVQKKKEQICKIN